MIYRCMSLTRSTTSRRPHPELVSDVLQLNKELIIADAFFKAGVWGIDLAGVNSAETWGTGLSDHGETFRRMNDADSDPLNLFKDLTLAIKQKIGVKPNTLVMGEQVYEEFEAKPHPYQPVPQSPGR